MAITYIGASTIQASSSGITVSVPTGYREGDFLLLCTLVATAQTMSTPSGWTSVGNYANLGKKQYFYKFAAASESSVALSDSGSCNFGEMLCFRGVDTTSPVNATATGDGLSQYDTDFSLPAITTTVANCMVLFFSGTGVVSPAPTPTAQTFTNYWLSITSNGNLTDGTNMLGRAASVSAYYSIGFYRGIQGTAGSTGSPVVRPPIIGGSNGSGGYVDVGYSTYIIALTPAPVLYADISYVAAGAIEANSSAITLGVPSGYAAGDLLLIVTLTATSEAMSTPSGWESYGSCNGTGCVSIFWRVATASESSVTLSDSGSCNMGVMLCFRGVNITTPINGTNIGLDYSNYNTSQSLPEITTTVPGCLILQITNTAQATPTPSPSSQTFTNYWLSMVSHGNLANGTNMLGRIAPVSSVYYSLGFYSGLKILAGATGSPVVKSAISTSEDIIYQKYVLALTPANIVSSMNTFFGRVF